MFCKLLYNRNKYGSLIYLTITRNLLTLPGGILQDYKTKTIKQEKNRGRLWPQGLWPFSLSWRAVSYNEVLFTAGAQEKFPYVPRYSGWCIIFFVYKRLLPLLTTRRWKEGRVREMIITKFLESKKQVDIFCHCCFCSYCCCFWFGGGCGWVEIMTC